MRLFLADLFHVQQKDRNPDTNPYTVPLGIGYLASTVRRYMPHITLRLFRDPDKLLSACRTEHPDIVGFSFCSWNTDLTWQCIKAIKAISPSSPYIVAGGPSVDDLSEPLAAFLNHYSLVDFAIPNEGETGLLSLLRELEQGKNFDIPISGVAYLSVDGDLIRGEYQRPIVLSESGQERLSSKQERQLNDNDIVISSPYLDGTLDEFLEEGLVPIIQTMRGCPYQCHFCVSGATEWNRLRGFTLERVKSEIDYAFSKSKSKDLILTDENWGILGDRDVDLANFIINKNKEEGTPIRLYYYTAKIVTPASLEIVKIVAPIAWIAEFSMSFQSLNPETRKEIKRTNISHEKLVEYTTWANDNNIITSSEMIYGFPHETPLSFFSGIEYLSKCGVDRVTVYPLQLFAGIDLASDSARKRYGFRTRFRLADCGFGAYDSGNLLAAECEEIVVGNLWSTQDDYLMVRRYAFFQQLLIGRCYFLELSRLCSKLGVNFTPIIRYFSNLDYTPYPALRAILIDHSNDAERELFDTAEEARAEVRKALSAGHEIEGVKLNLIYVAKIMSNSDAISELLEITNNYFKSINIDTTKKIVVGKFINEIMLHRIAKIESNSTITVSFKSHFDYIRFRDGNFTCAEDLLLLEELRYNATISEELRKNILSFDPTSKTSLQAIMDKTRKHFLLRDITIGAM